jgi:hypothetical protein
MNRIDIERDHWVERYLAGRLSDAEQRRFEAYWAENPGLVRDLEASAQLQSGLAMLRERGELDGLMRGSWWPGRFRLLVLAASVALCAFGALAWRAAQQLPAAVALASSAASLPSLQGASLPVGAVSTVMRMRSAGAVDAVVELPESPQALELRVLPDIDPESAASQPSRFEVTLVEEASGDLPGAGVASARIAAGVDGFLSVFVDSRTLRPARYRLRVDPIAGAAPVPGAPDFVVDVRRPTP